MTIDPQSCHDGMVQERILEPIGQVCSVLPSENLYLCWVWYLDLTSNSVQHFQSSSGFADNVDVGRVGAAAHLPRSYCTCLLS